MSDHRSATAARYTLLGSGLEPDGIEIRPGVRIGRYEILEAIGSGGMGEVWKARDTTLNRHVAIKALPAALADDDERLRRLQREAQLLAALNHPNIAAIHGLEAWGETRVLVLELVDGVTLADRLRGGALSVDDALGLALQISEAIEAAHGKGIVHRDLKPANIKVTSDGKIKVLDFGIAKAIAAGPEEGFAAPSMATETGMVIGTPAYMAPEQARGEPTGSQVDIWSFGVLLYELLTGSPPFRGPTAADTVAKMLGAEPDFSTLPSDTPPRIRHVIRRCLEKTQRRRFQHMGDVRIELEDLEDNAVASSAPKEKAPLRWIIATAACGLVTLGLAAALYRRGPAAATTILHSTIVPPGKLSVLQSPRFALSPDGRRLAIIALDPGGQRRLWIRLLNDATAHPLEGTEDADAPFWSPDSRSVAFTVADRLKRIDAAGGPAVTLAEGALTAPGTWSRDDVILFTSRQGSTLSRVPAAGGTPSAATALDSATGESTHAYPFFLPDGRHFVFTAWSSANAPLGIRIGSLDSMKGTPLLEGVTNAQYARDALLFIRGSTLMARAFDAGRRAFTGDAVPVADHISMGMLPVSLARTGAFSVSEAGVLVYHTAPSATPSRLVWLDREGREIGAVGDVAAYGDLHLSPDGQRVSVNVNGPSGDSSDLWLFDATRGVGTRTTFDSGTEIEGVWSPDGSRLVYNSNRNGRFDLYEKPANGVGDGVPLLETELNKYVMSWSPNGEFLLYMTQPGPNGSFDMWTLPLAGDRTPRPFLHTPFNEGFAASFSPDGRWICYHSDESGQYEVYVGAFPADPPRKRRISQAGGQTARWGPEGREIFYYEPSSGRLMSVPLTYGQGDVQAGAAKPLFKVRRIEFWSLWYDVTRDGQRFLVNTPSDVDTTTPLTLVVNWPVLLER